MGLFRICECPVGACLKRLCFYIYYYYFTTTLEIVQRDGFGAGRLLSLRPPVLAPRPGDCFGWKLEMHARGGKRGVSDLESRSRGGRRTGQRERRLGRLALPGEMFPFELKVHIQVFHGLEHELLTLAIYCFAVGWVMPAADLRS
jgi:hypothetical protein